jgi:hypothetical protein
MTLSETRTAEEEQRILAQQAEDNFAAAVRTTAFNLSLGIREIRMLKSKTYELAHTFEEGGVAASTAAKMVRKGLLQPMVSPSPFMRTRLEISEAGSCVCRLLTISRHIVFFDETDPIDGMAP